MGNEVFTSCIDANIVGGGPPTPAPAPGGAACAAEGDDCSSSSCCADQSKTCYVKDQYWASCRPECTPGIWTEDPPQYRTPWACDVRGVQGKPSPTPRPAPSPTPLVPEPSPSPSPEVDFGSGITDTSLVILACTQETTFALAVVVTFVVLVVTIGP